MFDHRHYVPVLKWKQGEQLAVRELTPGLKQRMTPLVEVPDVPPTWGPGDPKKTISKQVEDAAKALKKSWGLKVPIFVDLALLLPDGKAEHPVSALFRLCRSENVQAIPVTGPDRSPAYQAAVRDAVSADGRGMCIRLKFGQPEEALEADALAALMDDFKLPRSAVDLLIDFGAIGPTQASMVAIAARALLNQLPEPTAWRTLTLSASSFPLNLVAMQGAGSWTVKRAEWVAWRLLFKGRKTLQRVPTFADYGIQHPEPEERDPRMIRVSANVRYTAEDEWLILKARNIKKYGSEQYAQLCAVLRKDPVYRGAAFCWGDNYINECAKRKVPFGNPMVWRKVGTNHHLTLVAEQLASLPGL